MGGKHLKRLREEKSKVKLKKKLPKGQNITDTSFKVKKIIIAEQLPDHAGVPLTSKKQTLQECLNYLKHHNLKKQLDGLNGIKELFRTTTYSGNGLELRQIVTRVLDAAVEDKEAQVRRTCIKLLSEILSSLPGEIRSPFAELLNKQLKRGLSNINPGVQLDSLRLVDLVLAITPASELSTRRPLLPPLLRMLTTCGASAAPRIAVLERLLATCEGVFNISKENRNEVAFNKEVSCKDRIGPLTSTYKRIPVLEITNDNGQETSLEEQRNLINQLMKTSIGVWTEISPDSEVGNVRLQVLFLLTRLALLLYRYVSQDNEFPGLKSWFLDAFRDLIAKNLLSNFPFYGEKSMLKASDPEDQQYSSITRLNVIQATLYMCVQPKIDLLPGINKFLPGALETRPVSSEMVELLEGLMRVKMLQKKYIPMAADSCRRHPDDRLVQFLKNIALNDQYEQCHKTEEFQAWAFSLIYEPKYSDVISAIVARNANENLISTLNGAAEELLQMKPVMKHVVNTLYYVCSEDHLKSVAERCAPELTKYLHGIYYKKTVGTERQIVRQDHLSCL